MVWSRGNAAHHITVEFGLVSRTRLKSSSRRWTLTL